jgi:hypothetical protein
VLRPGRNAGLICIGGSIVASAMLADVIAAIARIDPVWGVDR